ncbi:hypothetical protein GDO86_011512 [Hymenochirus boettgeri]|uniref:Uncharacterized protein n=1 Tax=Hymenochirus boettgeri TaxID=247094 RepID=A0A8T2JJS1_9PIPI|nr:hypothetical protein GDO86_011512 [Hymenochirus boettgeri]
MTSLLSKICPSYYMPSFLHILYNNIFYSLRFRQFFKDLCNFLSVWHFLVKKSIQKESLDTEDGIVVQLLEDRSLGRLHYLELILYSNLVFILPGCKMHQP